jgi:3-oxoacyl-[acyl-carrier-protein] synthase-3
MMDLGVRIAGTGSYLPERVVTNHDLAKVVDTSDEWITSRTGIRERRLAAPEQATSHLAAEAARRALAAAQLEPAEVQLIIVATISPDCPFPNTACFVQEQIGALQATCFGIEAACSGFTYLMEIGAALLRTGAYANALLIGAEKLSAILNWQDRTTCVLFGDGAGAVVLKPCPPEENSYIAASLGADGRYTGILGTPGGGSRMPFSQDVLDRHLCCLAMQGQEVFKLAVNNMAAAAREALEKAQVTVDAVRWLIPHQANTRIIASVAKKVGVPEERVYLNLDRVGNTSAASIPIALDELVRAGRVQRGDYLLFVAFGGGLTWGANLIRW